MHRSDLRFWATCAYVAEQWGRRWITIDTVRVATAIARQRLLTARFDDYRLKDEQRGRWRSRFQGCCGAL